MSTMAGEGGAPDVAEGIAASVVRRYTEEIYHGGDLELVREICADPVVRHDPGRRTELSHDAQIERIGAIRLEHAPRFTWQVLAGDGRDAVLVWDCTRRDGRTVSGIEAFRIADGRIAEVWNAPFAFEPWG